MAYFDRIGKIIKRERKRARLTQKQLAERLGITYPYIGQIERGERHPKIETIQKISDALSVDILNRQREEEELMIKVEYGHVESYGQGLDLLAEGCIAMTEAIKRVSDKNDTAAESLFYSAIMTTAKTLKKAGIDVHLNRIACQIIEEGDDGTN